MHLDTTHSYTFQNSSINVTHTKKRQHTPQLALRILMQILVSHQFKLTDASSILPEKRRELENRVKAAIGLFHKIDDGVIGMKARARERRLIAKWFALPWKLGQIVLQPAADLHPRAIGGLGASSGGSKAMLIHLFLLETHFAPFFLIPIRDKHIARITNQQKKTLINKLFRKLQKHTIYQVNSEYC